MVKDKDYQEYPNKAPTSEVETQRFILQNLEDIGDIEGIFQWFENYAIQHPEDLMISIGETGTEFARIKKTDPKTQKEEIVYFTTDPQEISSFKLIKEGKTIVTEVSIEDIVEERIDEILEDGGSEDNS